MRKINVSRIKDAVQDLCLKANFELRRDVLKAIRMAVARESSGRAKKILISIIENALLAKKRRIAICQDTGMVFVHMAIGQGVAIVGGDLEKAINEAVKKAYAKGYLRRSVVNDPLLRENTGTNAPAVIFTEIVPGSKVVIDVSAKGFGSENKSAIRMFKPTSSLDDIKSFIIEVVKAAGPDACPPLVLGIGLGGTFEKAAYLAKAALLRPLDKRNPTPHMARLERALLKDINSLGIGPMGLGGRTTVLGVNILEHPTHIAGLPVAVNVSCHATRSARAIL